MSYRELDGIEHFHDNNSQFEIFEPSKRNFKAAFLIKLHFYLSERIKI
jgi:hypothetical protein